MKRIKKFAGALLAMAMVLGMTMTTFAAGNVMPQADKNDPTYTLTIKTVANHTYKIYQLATGDVSDDGETLSNVKVGMSAKEGTTVADIQALKDKTGAELGDAAFALINTKVEVTESVVGDGTEKAVTLPGGYYVVEDTFTNPDQVAEGDSVSRIMVSLVKDDIMTPKTVTVEPDKKIKEDNVGKETNEASIGDVIEYQLSGTIPDMTGYNAFKYVLVDTASKGLVQNLEKGDTLTGGIGTKSDDTKLVVPEAGVVVTYEVTEVTKNGDGTNTVRIAVKDAIKYAAHTGKWFYVDINATLTADADVVAIPNTNNVKIDFSNNPNKEYSGTPDFEPDEPKGTTVEVKVQTFTTSLTITKTDGADGSVLKGAEFKLESTNSANVGYVTGQEYVVDPNGTWYKLADGAYTEQAPKADGSDANKYASITETYTLKTVDKTTYTEAQTEVQAFVDENGKVVFTGLGVGDYKLTEVTTPNGYNTLAPISFKVEWSKEGGFNVTDVKNADTGVASDITISVDGKNPDGTGLGTILSSIVPNNKGTLLPSTGGIGTTIFYVVGGILVAGAGILLVTKKRMNAR